jgi:hypothetical protein
VSIGSMTEDIDEQAEALGGQSDSMLAMIVHLIGESNATYAQTLLASASQASDEAWSSFNAGVELDADINKLTMFHLMSRLGSDLRHKITQ